MDPFWGSIVYTMGVLKSRIEGSILFILPGLWVVPLTRPMTTVGIMFAGPFSNAYMEILGNLRVMVLVVEGSVSLLAICGTSMLLAFHFTGAAVARSPA